jgi:hypothetical protein
MALQVPLTTTAPAHATSRSSRAVAGQSRVPHVVAHRPRPRDPHPCRNHRGRAEGRVCLDETRRARALAVQRQLDAPAVQS